MDRPDLHRVGHGRAAGAGGDPRFARLVPATDWQRLPAAVRERYSRELGPTGVATFAGEVAHTRLTLAGRLLGQLARLIGAPLPLGPAGRVAACVVVVEDAAAGGQRWTRFYARPGRIAQVIHSTKCFAGPTGLEECVGGGVGMQLVVAVEDRCLVFRSAGFFWRIGQLKLRLPAWLTPGAIEVRHREERSGRFSFVLTVTHPWFGRIVEQVAFFEDCPASS